MTANSERLSARIKLWCLRTYIKDLELYQAGDEGRFTRMVGSGGVSLGSDSTWRAHVARLAADNLIVCYCHEELTELLPQIAALKIKIEVTT
jgi:hypothetical protein